jgi:hypothetical protein
MTNAKKPASLAQIPIAMELPHISVVRSQHLPDLHHCLIYTNMKHNYLGIFFFTTVSRMALGSTQPPIQWIPGALSLGVKQLGHEADHSPPSSAKVNNSWSYTSTPQYIFVAWCLVKHRDNFTLYFDTQL